MIKLHIGEEIERKAKEQNVSAQQIAGILGCHRNNVYRIFKTPSIDSLDLVKIAVLLKHDFFADYTELLKPLLPIIIERDINERLLVLEKDMADIKSRLFEKQTQ